MMQTIARFVTRPTGDGRSDILLGAFMQQSQDGLEPNTIYEIYNCLGTLNIRKIGKSLIAEKNIGDSPLMAAWSMEYQDVGARAGKMLLISEDEYKQIMAERQARGE